MIEEAYVSFEIAKLLKEKGFNDVDCECHGWIGRSGKHYSSDDTFYDAKELKEAQEDKKDYIPLITLQMAMRWLREKHNIHIVLMIENNGNYIGYLYDTKGNNVQGWDRRLSKTSYEDALETAIKYTLENLI